MSVWLLLFTYGTVLGVVAGHPDSAGSCWSPRSGFHGYATNGTGGYVLSVKPKQRHAHLHEMTLRLANEEANQTFRGFQIICEACQFRNLPQEDAHFVDTHYCKLRGRVTHTNNSDKKSVEIDVRLDDRNGTHVPISFYVVKTLDEWYGPINVTIDINEQHVRQSNKEPLNDGSIKPKGMLHNAADDKGGVLQEKCQRSADPDYRCSVDIRDDFILHWSLVNTTTDASPTKIDMMIEAKTEGWASLAFAGIKGKMHPADAVLGWFEENGHQSYHSYRILTDTVSDANRNASLFDLHTIDRQGPWLQLRFTKHLEGGYVSVNIHQNISLNYATGKENGLTKHDRWGSLEFDFITGQTHTVSSRKYYQAHGCLMILGWIFLVPLAITAARSKWSPSGMGVYGWLELHQALLLFAVIAIVSALLIAVASFQTIESRTGRVHRLLGILISIFLLCQVPSIFSRRQKVPIVPCSEWRMHGAVVVWHCSLSPPSSSASQPFIIAFPPAMRWPVL